MWLLKVLAVLMIASYISGQRVVIPNGEIQGRQEFSDRGYSFYAFQQIPYAIPPIGNLRFREPQPAHNWNGVLHATKNDKMCFQQSNSFNLSDKSLLENEDCLYLNVYTPEYPSSDSALPVMFYIYGGGFVNGAGNFDFHGPHYWMEHGIVLVTINYRVGPFGFISTGDTVIPGNYGLKDQLLALKWVQNNIKYFGGDPTKVTIFGQSAGGASVTYQLMSQKSKGLFRAAISQSGSILSPWGYQRHYKEYAYALASYIDPSFPENSSSLELLEFLQSVPATDLNNAASSSFPQNLYDNQIIQGFLFTPVIEPEHEDAFITKRMFGVLENGEMQRVPLLMGICSEEMIWDASDPDGFVWMAKNVDKNVSILVNDNMQITDEKDKNIVGQVIKNIYTSTDFEYDLGKLVQFYSDTSFGRGIIHHANVQTSYSDVYFYQFSYIGSMPGEHPYINGANRVAHSDDNYYLWAHNNISNLNSMPKGDILTSERYRILFSNFAKTLNPVSDHTDILGISVWPLVERETFPYLNINETLTVKYRLKKEIYEKWVDVYSKYAVEPFDTF